MAKRRLILNEDQLPDFGGGSNIVREDIVFSYVSGGLTTIDLINYYYFNSLDDALASIKREGANKIINAFDMNVTGFDQHLIIPPNTQGIFSDAGYSASEITVNGRNYKLTDYSPIPDHLRLRFNYSGSIQFTLSILGFDDAPAVPSGTSGNLIALQINNEASGTRNSTYNFPLNSILQEMQTQLGVNAVKTVILTFDIIIDNFISSPDNRCRLTLRGNLIPLTTTLNVVNPFDFVAYGVSFKMGVSDLNKRLNFKILDEPNYFTSSKAINFASLERGLENVQPIY